MADGRYPGVTAVIEAIVIVYMYTGGANILPVIYSKTSVAKRSVTRRVNFSAAVAASV